jgi:hypothetical protein
MRSSLSSSRLTSSIESFDRPICLEKELTMPELLIDFISSLDGYAAADGWPGWWGSKDPSTLGG